MKIILNANLSARNPLRKNANRGGVGASDECNEMLCTSDRSTPLCVGFSEIDKYAIQVYNKHFNHKNYGDITKINEKELPDFDLICGGFPCQSFSIAGKRKGFEDTRGTLFFDIARIIKEKRPRYILLENVKGLLSHDKGRTFAIILSSLDELGYDLQWQVLNSKNFGVPQNRERVFIIGYNRGQSRRKVFLIGENDEKYNEVVKQQSKITGTINSSMSKGGNKQDSKAKVLIRHPLKFLSRNQKNIEGDYCFTVDTFNTGGIKQGDRIRRLTPLECERLQGFPDNWTAEGSKGKISDGQRYKMCGNAVTVNVIEEIIKSIIQ